MNHNGSSAIVIDRHLFIEGPLKRFRDAFPWTFRELKVSHITTAYIYCVIGILSVTLARLILSILQKFLRLDTIINS